MSDPAEPSSASVKLRYEQTSAVYASQFVVNASQEDLVINFSSGYINDPRSGENTLPIHTRVAMSPAGVSRLVNTLTRALKSIEEARNARASQEGTGT